MGLEKYILYLISTDELVYLPDFGGFISKHISAHLDTSTHVFTPPRKQVAYNDRLIGDASRLISIVSDRESISVAEAENLVTEFVSKIKTTLSENKEFQLKGIGFFYPIEHKVGFKSFMDFDSDPFNFGLPQILVKDYLPQSAKRGQLQKTKNRKAISPTEVDSVLDSGKRNSKSDETYLGQNLNNTSKPLVWLYLVAPLVLIVGLGVFFSITEDGRQMLASMHIFSSKSIENDTTNQTQLQIEPIQDTAGTTSKSFKNATSAEESIKKLEEEKWEDEPLKYNQEDIANTEDAKLAIANIISDKSGRSFIIAGGFSNKKNAVILREKLILEGLESKIIAPTKDGALFRVTLGDYPTKTTALQKIKEFKPNYGNDIWVMVY